jgi:hypothetical protein
MKRRTILWLSLIVVLLAGVALAWMIFNKRDADFQAFGPRTRGVRANFATLDTTIDAADFHDCKSLDAVLKRLNKKFGEGEIALWHIVPPFVSNKVNEIEPDERRILVTFPVTYPAESTPMTVKQFLRMTFSQAYNEDIGFVVGRYGVTAMTRERFDEKHARYVESVPFFERFRNAWEDMTGHVEDDPPVAITITTLNSYRKVSWKSP